MIFKIKTSDGGEWSIPAETIASKVAKGAVKSPNGRIDYREYLNEYNQLLQSRSTNLHHYLLIHWQDIRHLAVKASGPVERIEDIVLEDE
jgi:hypothetical protein